MSEEPFIIDDDRYSRMRLIAWWDQDKLAAAKILVVGIGALGNEVAKNLALMGVGNVFGIDMDTVEDSNLTRSVLFRQSDNGSPKVKAAERALGELNPDTRFHPIEGNIIADVGLGLVREMDVVIGCLDNREARLWVNRMCWKTGTPWVDGGIQEINGVAKVFRPPDGACYECAMTENDYRLMNLRYSCPLLKREDIQQGKVPTAPTISSIIAGLQTQEALKLIHDLPVEDGTAMVFNGVANNFYKSKYQHDPDCLSHDPYGEPVKSPLSAESTLAAIFDFARKRIKGDGLSLHLDRDLVTTMDCPACGNSEAVFLPVHRVGEQRIDCPACGEKRRPVLVHKIPDESSLRPRKASELGIPPYDLLRICSDDEEIHVELTGDRNMYLD